MAHHAQHAKSRKAPARAAFPLLGLAAAGLGILTAPAAHAASLDPSAAGKAALSGQDASDADFSEVGSVPLYPLAGTPLDLLSNNVRVPVGGMDVSTFPVTAPLRDGLPLREVPLVGSFIPQ